MPITNLGFRTDVTLRVLEGGTVTDRGDHLVIRSPDNPTFWWGNFLLLSSPPAPGSAATWLAAFAAEFPAAGHVALGVDTARDDAEVPDDFPAAGLEPQRETVLTCPAVSPPSARRRVRTRRRRSGGIVADPAEGAIRVYRACGFADAQGQLSFQRPPG